MCKLTRRTRPPSLGYMQKRVLISPSILAFDNASLGAEVKALQEAGADYIHIDVMDGLFVPNITYGPNIVAAIRKHTDLPLDVHLMIQNPENHIEAFISAGSDILTIHQEACQHLDGTLRFIKDRGVRAGIALNPSSHPNTVEYLKGIVDYILVMSVNPGFCGQKFLESQLPKVQTLSKWKIEVAVDGGITEENIQNIIAHGASTVVAGSEIAKCADYSKKIKAMRVACL